MQNKTTQPTKAGEIKRAWHMIDVKDKTLGRISTEIAKLLMGKSKAYFARNLDCGDYVVIVNAKEVKVSGNKEEQKKYYRYSGYPSGLSIRTLANVRKQDAREIITHAVKGMLPQNRLRDSMLTRLFIYTDAKHPYGDKFKKASSV